MSVGFIDINEMKSKMKCHASQMVTMKKAACGHYFIYY